MEIDTSNYIAGGTLALDIERWFAAGKRAECKPPLDVGAFIERLPPTARSALIALDKLVMSGGFPSMSNFGITSNWSYGVNLKANGQNAHLAEKDVTNDIFPLAADGGGNLFVHLLDGRVGIWSHEESLIEDHTMFSSLDECLWIMLRVESVEEDDGIDAQELKGALEQFGGETGAAHYLEWLEEWLEDQ